MAKIKICLDAGHYGKYNRSPAVKSYYESEMNWKLHLLLKNYLEQYGIEVILTRADQTKDKALTTRGKVAKGCDLFISIHSNAVGSGVNESVDYPVVYVPLNGKGDEIGKKLADCVESVMATKQKGRISSRKGNNGDYYGVIRGAVSVGVPGLIIEHSFHTNTRATNWLLDESNLDRMAKAEAEVIAAHYGVKKPESTSNTSDNKTNAETAAATKKATDSAKGFLESLAGTYKVTASSLNVRNGAGTAKKIMVSIPKGTAVRNYGYYTSYLGTKWLYIQFTYKNVTYTGFASSKYLKK